MQIRRATFGAAVILSVWFGMSIGGPWTIDVLESPIQPDSKINSDDQSSKEGHKLPEHLPVGTLALHTIFDWLAASRDNLNALSTLTVAIFTYVLARKTAGLDNSTRKLWDAGERQIELARANSEAQSRDMQASLAAARVSSEAARESAKIAKDALVAAHRPWIKVTIEADSDLRFDENGSSIAVLFHLDNIGQSPARKVVVMPIFDTTIIGAFGQLLPQQHQAKLIANVKSREQELPFGYSIFPGDRTSQPTVLSIQSHTIAEALQQAEFLQINLFGIVEYTSNFSDKPHVTGFIWRITRRDRGEISPTGRFRSRTAIFPDEGDVAKDDLVFMQSFTEGSYMD